MATITVTELIRRTEAIVGENYDFFHPTFDFNYAAFYRCIGEIYIVIILPIKLKNYQPVLSGKKILLVVRSNHQDLFWLRDTLLENGAGRNQWEGVLREKIKTVEWAVKLLYKCNWCGGQLILRLCHNKKKTKFVSGFCPCCQRFISTPYGIGIKTRLHSLLRRKPHKIFQQRRVA